MLMANPFAKGEAQPDVAPPTDTEETTVWDTADEATEDEEGSVVAATADDDVEDEVEDPEYGKLDTDDDDDGGDADSEPEKPKTVPLKRLSRVVRERNEARAELGETQVKLESIEAELSTLRETQKVLDKHYADNPSLLDFDVRFLSTMEEVAKSDPLISQAAQRIMAMMNGDRPVSTNPTPNAPETSSDETTTTLDPLVAKVIEKDVTKTFLDVLGQNRVKESYAKAVLRDVMAHVDLTDLAEATPADVVEFAKTYFASTGAQKSDYLLPKDGTQSTPGSASGRKAATKPAGGKPTQQAEAGRDRPKTLEEFQQRHENRFAELASGALSKR